MIDLIYDNGFKERFALLIKYFGTAANAAKLVGIAPDQIGRWRDGTARPAFFPIASLCVAAGVSIDWLATGVLKDRKSVV